MRELPKLFKARMKQQLKEEYEDFLACYEREGYADCGPIQKKFLWSAFAGCSLFLLNRYRGRTVDFTTKKCGSRMRKKPGKRRV